jgi:predicted dehydrogenase
VQISLTFVYTSQREAGDSLSTPPFRIAVVGAGAIAVDAHLPVWAGRPDVEVAYVVDSDLARAEQAANLVGAHAASDLSAVLGEGNIDAVDICTPPHLHSSMIEQALDAGAHVLVEKPLAATLEEARQLASLQKRSDRIVMVAENWLFSSARTDAERAVAQAELGRPFLVKAWHESSLYIPEEGLVPAWTFSPTQAQGGYLMQAGIHTLSLLNALVGQVAEVYAYVDEPTPEVGVPLDRTAVLGLQFEHGAMGSAVLTGRSRREGPRRLGMELYYDEGVVTLDVWSGAVTCTVRGQTKTVTSDITSMGFREEIDHFVSCMRTGAEPITSPSRIIPSLESVFAAYSSAATGRPVRPESVGR